MVESGSGPVFREQYRVGRSVTLTTNHQFLTAISQTTSRMLRKTANSQQQKSSTTETSTLFGSFSFVVLLLAAAGYSLVVCYFMGVDNNDVLSCVVMRHELS